MQFLNNQSYLPSTNANSFSARKLLLAHLTDAS